MFDENTIIILIVLLLLFYFFCKKDVVEGVDPKEKPPIKEEDSKNEGKPPIKEEDSKDEGKPPIKEEDSKDEGKPSVKKRKSNDTKKESKIKVYGNKKEKVVKPSETSQELRNFVSTNFEGLVKNEFKFCETKGHKNGEQCSNDVDIRSGLRNWAKGKNISTDTTPPKTMIVQIQSFLDQQNKVEEKKTEEMKKPEEMKKTQEIPKVLPSKKQEIISTKKKINPPKK